MIEKLIILAMFKYFLIIFCIFIYSCASKQDQYYGNYKTPYQYQNQYAPIQQYQPYQPNSRAYNNPYAFPQQYAPPFYDSDQYYVPPNDYYNVERIQNSPANNKY